MKTRDDIKAIQLSDYRQPSFWARKVFLSLDLDPDHTRVVSRVLYEHNPGHDRSLHLNGKDLRLSSVKIDGVNRALDTFFHDAEHLHLENLPDRFELEIATDLCPKNNTALEGLYLSRGAFFSQCEAQGFRRFTYYLDRPDVMAVFETTIRANKTLYPVLLSNGNFLDSKDLPDGRHEARWHDPFPKPAYLFALVAGDLGHREDSYTTRSGKKIGLHIYVEKENLAKCSFAFTAIQKSMQWDEETYGLEYDLDVFMVVAVNDFNMGAMENKGLNIFNSKYVLASPETATDKDYENILGIVGHEYFHNWSGNRVTLRDWFQLSLKEGLTVFRDQQFSAHHGSEAVKRIL
ncbi:MAG: aminopeptidase N, partial [Proteobacteria bacterium]